jgi:hypothetical protein
MLLEQIWALPGSAELHSIVLNITQEDGRTAYAEGYGSRDYGKRTLDLRVFAMFSDRINTALPPVQKPGGIIGDTQKQLMSNLEMDGMDLSIAENAIGGVYLARIELLRWGASYSIDLRLSPGTRTYQAEGPTIGNAPGYALYVISFP